MSKKDHGQMGHNSEKYDEGVMEIITEYSESLERSAAENDIRKELRERAEDQFGLPSKVVQTGVSRLKSSLSEQEGFDEGMATIKRIADDMGGAESIFSWYVEKQAEREKAREEVKAEKAKKKRDQAKQAKKDEEYKPATERKPSEGKSKGEAQAKAVLDARAEQAENDGE